MAEISTLSPSSPALGDPHTAPTIPQASTPLPVPSIPSPDPARDVAIAKSSLCNDKVLTGNSPAPQTGAPLASPDAHFDSCEASSGHEPAPQRGDSARKDEETGSRVVEQETAASGTEDAGLSSIEAAAPVLSSEGSPQNEVQPTSASVSPECNSAPNLYPNVQVSHSPNPVVDDGQFTAGPPQPQDANASNPASAAPQSTDGAAAAEGEKSQPLEQAQKPQSQPPPLSPKPEIPPDKPPSTPTRAEHPSPSVPVIQEPASAFPLPNPNPRQAPDTLSYLESASMMSGTLESLSGLGEDGSSLGSDSEINGLAIRRTDKYGFLGGSQYNESG